MPSVIDCLLYTTAINSIGTPQIRACLCLVCVSAPSLDQLQAHEMWRHFQVQTQSCRGCYMHVCAEAHALQQPRLIRPAL